VFSANFYPPPGARKKRTNVFLIVPHARRFVNKIAGGFRPRFLFIFIGLSKVSVGFLG
jgi:hypothetical protein